MEDIDVNKYILVEEHHRILLCRLCRSAVRPGPGLEDHFRHVHRVKGQELREIKYYVADMDLLDSFHVALPGDGSAPIGGLDSIRGYGCRRCRYYTRARDNMTRHWRTAGHVPTDVGHGWKEVLLQTWSRGRYARYWDVRDGGEQVVGQQRRHGSTQEGTRGDADDGLGMMERKNREFEAELARQDAERLRQGDAEEGLERESAWVKRLG
ncbi:hypothetical protein K456DRAFT_1773637 [Colletotrichum gloeosporioides 23]|nr:hypothetical protein K456DRAFT_1773637 [Colletotrichum gloeosporioides 23]KAJ0267503.1 hypothetical protein COL940_014305 [Colletotrichum noveboracense]KAJ0270331.1 hypothetical protein CBS470a_013542 [Colletotrichum nupharicola]KAJ0297146.1 hypothetical protein Brms1b_013640 [Colletotrichum noveboracense]